MEKVPSIFTAKLFPELPSFMQSPADLGGCFILNWEMELQARNQINPMNPYSPEVGDYLGPEFQADRLGELLTIPEWHPFGLFSHLKPSSPARHERGRLVTLFLASTLFSVMNDKRWNLSLENGTKNPFMPLTAASEVVTNRLAIQTLANGDPRRFTLFENLDADLAKGMMLDMIEEFSDNPLPQSKWSSTEITPNPPHRFDKYAFETALGELVVEQNHTMYQHACWSTAKVLYREMETTSPSWMNDRKKALLTFLQESNQAENLQL